MSEIIDKVTGFLEQILMDFPEVFLVQVRIKPTNNIKVFIDTDEGITIEKCIKVNRKLYAAIEEAVMFDEGDFSLEVSSPGIGEPIVLNRQYLKNVGRNFVVTTHDDAKLEGVLKDCTEDGIVLEVTAGKGKKLTTVAHSLLFTEIKKAAVEVKF